MSLLGISPIWAPPRQKKKDPMPDLTLEMTLKYDKCLSSQNKSIL